MAKGGSAAFARIKGDVLAIVRAVPPGGLVSFAAVGAHLDVMPRHVAYILATLDDAAALFVPWHRAIAADGRLGGQRSAEQAALLADEGIALRGLRVIDPEAALIAIEALDHGVPQQRRTGQTTSGN